MHRVRKSVEIVLLASALLIVGFGKMEISTRQEELKVYQRLTGNGYYLSTMEITNSPGISRQTVDKLEQVAGVTSVEQYHNNEKEEFWIDLSEYAESEYFQKVVETLVAYLNETSIKEKISIEKVRLSLLTIDRWQDIQRFLRNLDEGSLTKEEFEQLIREDGLIEYAQYVENYYGTPRKYVEEQLSAGKDVILEIEIQGAMKIREKFPDTLLVFVCPPSMEELKNRLVGRGTETLDVINGRLRRAVEESRGMDKYDYLLINDDLEECVDTLHETIRCERMRTSRNHDFVSRIQKEAEAFL